MSTSPARSAIVRATLRTRSYALALRWSSSMALRKNSLPSESNLQWVLSKPCDISAFERHFDFPAKRCCWSLLARNTLSRIAPDDSARSSLLSSLYSTAGASTWISMRSSSGPEIRHMPC